MKIRALGAVAALTLVLTACGGDDEAASKAVSTVFMEGSTQVFEVTREQADCVGDGLVEEIGSDKLTDYGLLTEDGEAGDLEGVKMSEGDSETAARVTADCADLQKTIADAMKGQVPEEQQQCVDDNLTDELLQKVLAASYRDDQDAVNQEITGAFSECLAPPGG